MTRYLLYGGKGGVGKTTCAAATALTLAREGHETLVVSTDPAHSLSDSFDRDIGAEPTEVRERCFAVEIDPETRMDAYREMTADLFAEFDEVGVHVDDEEVEELFAAGIVPGGDEVAALDTFVEFAEDDRWDRIVFDTAPTGHTLRLLDLPSVMSSAVETVMSLRVQVRRLADSAKRMVLGPAYYLGGSEDRPDDFAALQARMEQAADLLRDPEQTSFRVVLVPEQMALAETERLVARLRAFEIPVGGLVVNKVLTDPDADCSRCQARYEAQQAVLEAIRGTFDLSVQELPARDVDVRGVDALDDLADRLDT